MSSNSAPPSGNWNHVDFYDAYPRVEERFSRALDESLRPRGPEALYELVRALGLDEGARVLDAGCGEGAHARRLAGRFDCTVHGIDPVERHIELARAAASVVTTGSGAPPRVSFALGSVERIPLEDASIDLVWCRDVLIHVADLDRAFAEFRRVLAPGGRAIVYQMFATDRLEPDERRRLFATMGAVEDSADAHRMEAAMADAGLRVEQCVEFGPEWGEYAEEQQGSGGRRLLHAARLLRDPQRYIDRFGQTAYDIMLGDCLWHVYRMIGKLSGRAYVLTTAPVPQ